ncbi:hypothetical protein [Pilimelia columellifera]|uniref:Serine protease n=1 Tax=Pilimelia columellifera subsp. columellifera TaxID=706583 RepID=A0ABP6A639_9ACTN
MALSRTALATAALTTAVLAASLLAPTAAAHAGPAGRADVGSPAMGYLLGAGSGLAHSADSTARCTAGFLLRVNGERQVLASGQCAGPAGGAVLSLVAHAGLNIGTVTTNGLLPDAGARPLDAAIFAPRPGIYSGREFLTREGRVYGLVTSVASEGALVGSRYLRSGKGTELTEGVVTDSRLIDGQRHFCGDGPTMAAGDLGGPVVLRGPRAGYFAAAGMATTVGDDGRMCFLPMGTLLTRFNAELGRPGSD